MLRWLERLPRPRVRVRTLLLVVALVAVVAGAWRALQRQHEAFLRREYYRALVAEIEQAAAQLDGMARGEEDMARKSQEFARRWRSGELTERQRRALRGPPESGAEQAEKRAQEFANLAASRRKTLAAVNQLLPDIRRLADRAAQGHDPRAEAELRSLLQRLP
jgi:cytochrome c556